MKCLHFFVPLFLLLSCDLRPEEDRIRIPRVTKTFYENAATKLERELERDPANESLVELQLSYYEKLGWPVEAEHSINRAMNVLNLEPVVSRKYADFFMINNRYEDLMDLSENLEEIYEKPEWMWEYQIVAANRVNRHEEAKALLRNYFTRSNDDQAHLFGGKEYLEAGDSLLSFYHLQQVKDVFADDREFVEIYVPLAFNSRAYQEVLDAIEAYDEKAMDITLKYKALSLYRLGDTQEAKGMLWSIPGKESLLTLSGWYAAELKWDSCYLALDKILVNEPDDLEVLMTKGRLDDQRGWFTRASLTFSKVLEKDSTHNEAREMLDLVNRKIAYLRRIREANQEIPTIELDSKKAIQ